MAKRQLDVVIAAQNQTPRAFASVGQGLSGLSQQLTSMRNLALGGLGIYALVNLVRESITAFGKQEQAVRNLSDALNLLGAGGQAAVDDMKKFAAGIQKQTIIDDEVVLGIMALGASMGKLSGQQLQDATVAAIGLSRAYKMDLEASMRLVAKAAMGNTSQLKRFGIVLAETLSPQEKFNALLRIGADNFSLATGEAQTDSGKLEQFKNTIGDLKETLGDQLMPVVVEFTDWIKKDSEALTNSLQIVGILAKGFLYLGRGIYWTGEHLGWLANKAIYANAKLMDFLTLGLIGYEERLDQLSTRESLVSDERLLAGLFAGGPSGPQTPPPGKSDSEASAKEAVHLRDLEQLKIKILKEGMEEEEETVKLKYKNQIEAAEEAGDNTKILEEMLQWELYGIRKKYADKEQDEQRKQTEALAKERLDSTKGLFGEISNLWINITKTGLDKELALLAVEYQEAMIEAQRLGSEVMEATQLKFALKQQQIISDQAETAAPADRFSELRATESRMMSRAPGYSDPYAQLHKDNQDQIKLQDGNLKITEQVKEVLERMYAKMGSGEGTSVLTLAE